MNKKEKEEIYSKIIDSIVEGYMDDFNIESNYSGIYVAESSLEYVKYIPQKYEEKFPDDYYELEDGLEEYLYQKSNTILSFLYEDSRLSGSTSIYEIKSKNKGSIIIQDHEEYANVIAVVKDKSCKDIERKIAKMYCFYEHESLDTYMGNIPSDISIGFTCSHKFIVWILYNLIESESLWSSMEEKYPEVYNLDYEFPKIEALTNSVKGGGPKSMTFSKRTINQSKYRFLEENYSFEAINLSYDDSENSLADSDRGTKEKALIRYLKRFM